MSRQILWGYLVMALPLCGCSFRTPPQTEPASSNRVVVISLHGEFRLMAGGYDVTICSNGDIVYSNYPLPVIRMAVPAKEVIEVLSEMRKTGFWTIDESAIAKAMSDAFVTDATQVTLTALWQDDVRSAIFVRPSLFSSSVKKSKDVKRLRFCVTLIERRLLGTEVP